MLALTAAMADELAERYAGTDAAPSSLGPQARFVVAVEKGTAIGCGAMQPIARCVGEIKRLYVVPEWRGRGVARRILTALEARARTAGWQMLRLETGRLQYEAIALYESAGYLRVPLYGPYLDSPYSVCFARTLLEV